MEQPARVSWTFARPSFGTMCLCGFLILLGLDMLVHIAIPGWVTGILALMAGFFMLIGI